MKNNDIKFETLRKPIRKKIIIGSLVAVAIVSAITLTTSLAKYRLTQSIPVVRGKIFYYNGDLNVMAVKTSEDGTNYNDSDTIPTSGYTFNTTKSVCKIPSNDTYVEDKTITMEYKDGKVYIGVSKKKTKCYLYFDKIRGITASQLLATVKSKSNGEKSSFESVATTNEGIFEASDGMYGGTSYYWRGAVTDNHVIFANYCWRIIRINGDGTIRLIYNGAVQSGNTCLGNGANETNVEIRKSYYHADTYNQSYYVGWTYSDNQRPSTSINNGSIGTNNTIKNAVETWYNTNIGYTNSPYVSKVASGKYCNDRNFGSAINSSGATNWSATGAAFGYAAYTRLYTNKTPTLGCRNNGDIYQVNVGLITSDEVAYAGGVYGIANQSYYLYSNSLYWTMSPYNWVGSNANVMCVRKDGSLGDVLITGGGVRPVINLSTSVTFNANSDGTQNNPYVVQ